MGGLERSTWWRAAALFGLFFAPRVALLGDARWTGEESWFFWEIYQTAQGERWSALGTPVSGTRGAHPGPYFYFLLAPFAWSGSPWLTSLGVALLDSLGHLLALMGLATLLTGRPHRRVALTVAALILALSPWALLYADRPWNSNLVSLPVGLALLGFARWLEAPQRWRAFALLTIGLATLPSFHMSAPIIGLPMLMMVAWRWRTLRPASVITGAALSVIIWSPYALHELKHSGANTRGLMTRSLPAVSDTENTLLALSWPWRLVAPEIGYHAQKGYWSPYQPSGWRQPGSSAQRSWRAIHGHLAAPGVVLGGLLMLTLWVAYLVSLRKRDQRDSLSLLWLSGTLIGWGLLLIAGRRAYPHYLQPLLPYYAAVVGLGFAQLWDRPKLRSALGLSLAISLGTGLVVTERFQRLNDRPFGLSANLYTADLMQRFGSIKPVFCGALGYRNERQLSQLMRVTHPDAEGGSSRGYLIHLLEGEAPAEAKRLAQWSSTRYGIQHFLVLGALPQPLRRLGCR